MQHKTKWVLIIISLDFVVAGLMAVGIATWIRENQPIHPQIAEASTVQNQYHAHALTHTTTSATPSVHPAPAMRLVAYNGPVQHIFFHPLLAYPESAFHDRSLAQGFNDWFITVREFDRIIASLYKRQFILIDIRMLYTQKTVHGHTAIVPKQLYLPKGKKPLMISIDDMNYYHYMIGHGTVSRLILDAHGHTATLSKDQYGRTVISHTNEIVPILNAFVRKHPDFSFDGAKGMIDLTGYEGVLGYRTNELSSPHYPQIKAAALRVIQHLKATGWTFASHSWGHLDDHAISYQTFVADTMRWEKEVEPLVGPTPVYVYPFGSRVTTNGAKYQFLLRAGFRILFSVGPRTYVQWTSQSLMMDRRHMDGIALHEEQSTLTDLFNPRKVIDPIRPNVY